LAYILSISDSMGLSSFKFFSGGLRKTSFSARVHFGRSRSSSHWFWYRFKVRMRLPSY